MPPIGAAWNAPRSDRARGALVLNQGDVCGLAGGHDPQKQGRRPPPTTRWMPRKAGAERQVAAADAGGVGGARWRRVAFAGAASFVVPRSPGQGNCTPGKGRHAGWKMTPRITPWSARWRRRVAVGRRNATRVIAWWCDECRRCSNIVYCFLSIDFHAQIASQMSIVGTPHRGAARSAQAHRVHGPISARSKPHPWGPSRTGSRTRIEGSP